VVNWWSNGCSKSSSANFVASSFPALEVVNSAFVSSRSENLGTVVHMSKS
jgi:hypothetical protein